MSRYDYLPAPACAFSNPEARDRAIAAYLLEYRDPQRYASVVREMRVDALEIERRAQAGGAL